MAEEEVQDEQQQAPKKKKLSGLMIGMILQTLILLGCIGVIVKVFFFSPKPNLAPQVVQERVITSIRDSVEAIRTMELEQITVNLVGDHSLRAAVVLELSNDAVKEELTKRLPIIKAKMLKALSEQSFNSLDRIQGKLQLKDRLLELLNDELAHSHYKGDGMVRDIFFQDLILM